MAANRPPDVPAASFESVPAQPPSFEDFFRRWSGPLLGQAFLLTADFSESQDLVQEVMSRAWKDWGRVSRYSAPEAWARTVLHRLAVGRWRHLQVIRRHAAPTTSSAPAPEADHLDVAKALNALPAMQRRSIVLHDYAGLSVAEVAAELGAAEGTVKSWLSRGRAALAAALHIEVSSTGGR